MTRLTQVKRLDTAAAFTDHLAGLGVELPFDPVVDVDALAQPLEVAGRRAGNRFVVLPMEGWDATVDGRPTDLVRRRWRRFGHSGAKLIWGGEAVAVRADGRANPRQLVCTDETVDDLAGLRTELVEAHGEHFGTDDLVVGLQLTHSGRYAHLGPRTAYAHPVLDARVGADGRSVLTDAELAELRDDMISAAGRAAAAGFHFVDVKCCHGYLGHELLSAVDRPGPYGGDFAGRTRWITEVIEGIRRAVPDLAVGVRLSAYDVAPHAPGADGHGEPEATGEYRFAFGGDGTGAGVDLAEPLALLDHLAGLGVGLVCVTAASPYYAPHVQRPAYFPPSDGYSPPGDPLVDVARLVEAADRFAAHRSDVVVVGSGYSYLQEWVGHVAGAVVRSGAAHMVGLGRMVLSYPDLPADLLAGRPLYRRKLCRTFSDCTTAPRAGLVSGCYPLDDFYAERPEKAELVEVKRRARARLRTP
ncbi:NADH:flavin oxidoreductase [soil metagenome]